MKLYIICGHGDGDSGALSRDKKYREAERVRTLGKKMKELGGDSVVLLDTNVNWYATNGIANLSIPSGDCLIELHMDSYSNQNAKGGHVIISNRFDADEWDTALAKYISGVFPGRSNIISKRGDLQNVNVAANRGINYRLIECCFISNDSDLQKFNANINDIAKGILGCFGIQAGKAEAKKEETVKQTKTVEQLAIECIRGDWGNGADRKSRLTAAGYDYDAVQKKVNKILLG